MSQRTDLFRNAAIEIAEELVAKAEYDEFGVSWPTAAYDVRTETFSWVANVSLYDGTAGIALFMLEAGNVLGNARYRELALDALRWCAAVSEKVSQPFLFYGGPLGLAYVLARAHEVTGDGNFLELAQRVNAPRARVRIPVMPGDFVSGTAGTILGLLHLHAAIGEAWIIEMLDRLLADLAERGRWTPQGVTWSADKENIRGLCGMAHGNAGVAFVLVEASHYLDRPELLRLALEAQRYEAAFFNPDDQSWPDFRRAGRMPDDVFALRYGNSGDEFFSAVTVMDAWCHGAPGIGLGRLRAYELLGTEPWREDALHAIARTEERSKRSSGFTLCHGHCGNAVTLIEAARVLRNPEYLAIAEAVGEKAIASRQERGFYSSGFWMLTNGSDLSLMMGNAGIGHFYLQLLDPTLRSPLLPYVATQPQLAMPDGLTEGGIARRLTSAMMPATVRAIEEQQPAALVQFFSAWRDRNESLAFLRANAVAGAQWELDAAKLDMLDHWPSLALSRYQEWRAREDIGSAMAGLPAGHFRIAPYARLWHHEETGSAFLLKVSDGIVTEQPLAPLADVVLSAFAQERSLDEVCDVLRDVVPFAADVLRNAVEQQMRAAITAGFLVRGD